MSNVSKEAVDDLVKRIEKCKDPDYATFILDDSLTKYLKHGEQGDIAYLTYDEVHTLCLHKRMKAQRGLNWVKDTLRDYGIGAATGLTIWLVGTALQQAKTKK